MWISDKFTGNADAAGVVLRNDSDLHQNFCNFAIFCIADPCIMQSSWVWKEPMTFLSPTKYGKSGRMLLRWLYYDIEDSTSGGRRQGSSPAALEETSSHAVIVDRLYGRCLAETGGWPLRQAVRSWLPQSHNHKEMNSVNNLNELQCGISPVEHLDENTV